MPAETILLVDDEPQIVVLLGNALAREGFSVLTAATAADAVTMAAEKGPDLLILDLTLPDGSGFEVFRRVSAHRRIPTIMLTARRDEVDRVAGLEMGADDYVTKPFSPRELIARVRALLRRVDEVRTSERSGEILRVRDLTIDREAHDVRMGARSVALTPTEFRILVVLAEHAGQVLTRGQLLDRLQDDGDIFERTLDRHIANLRKKLEPEVATPSYVVTVFGVGYKLS